MSVPLDSYEDKAAVAGRPSESGVAIVAVILLVVGLSAAISVDVVRAGYKIKGDEATYVGMALSMAYDGDLKFERRDLERFWGFYQEGPEGIFLKRGKQFRVRLRATPPFLFIFNNTPEPRIDRLYFGKAMIYSVAVAPFVRLFGMNGFYVFHVLLLFVTGVCGYLFLAARSRPGPALIFTVAFFAASVLPVHAVFLTSDLFNFGLVFIAYFLWLYKEVAEPRLNVLKHPVTDVAAAFLLGVATYSKLSNAPLVAPLVLLHWWRRRWPAGFLVGVVSVVSCLTLFTMNALISGEFNYQGGDRKIFYSVMSSASTAGFPFDSPQAGWDQRGSGGVGTDDLGAQDSLVPSEVVRMLVINTKYFIFGRHFGFVPYFFPAVVAFLAWIFSRHRFEPWRVLTFGGVFLATLLLLIVFPYTWSGGGGPPGNRYFLSVYPALFFLMPPVETSIPGLLAWVGGALFTAKMLVNPFVAAKFTWETTERGWARRLPVELTMANDLPVRLAQPLRAHILYRQPDNKPTVLLYFLDQHAYPPEPEGMWIAGDGRADIIVRTDVPLDHLAVTALSPINTDLIISAGAETHSVRMKPQTPVSFDLPVSGVKGFRSWAYLLSARSTEGFIPHLLHPEEPAHDGRNLGVQLKFQAVVAAP